MECSVQKRVEKMRLCGKHPLHNLITKDLEKRYSDYLLLFDFNGDVQSVILNNPTEGELDMLVVGNYYSIKFRIVYNNDNYNRSSRIIIDSISSIPTENNYEVQ